MLGGLTSRMEWGADSGIRGSVNSNVLGEESFNGWMEGHHIVSPLRDSSGEMELGQQDL